MTRLCELSCKACRGDLPALKGQELESYRRQVPGWEVVESHHLRRVFKFGDFKSALAFVNQVGELAEEENHHPEICFTWGRAEVKIYTHKVDALTESDFILAAKIDEL